MEYYLINFCKFIITFIMPNAQQIISRDWFHLLRLPDRLQAVIAIIMPLNQTQFKYRCLDFSIAFNEDAGDLPLN